MTREIMQIIPTPEPSSSSSWARARLLALLDEGSRWSFLRAGAGFDKSLTVRSWLHADPRLLETAQWIQLAPGDRVDIRRLDGLLAGRRRPRIIVLDATTSDVPLDVEALRAVGAFSRHVIVIARSVRVLPDHLPSMLDARLIDAEALAYRSDEIAAIPGLGTRWADRILRETAGWPALVRLIGSHEPRTSLELGRVIAHFAEEQLSRLSPLASAVVGATCIAVEPTAELTSLLSGLAEDEARRGWDELVAEGLAAVEGVGGETRWRLIPVVREAHLGRRRQDDPEGFRQLDRRAARWFAGRSLALDAVRHAVAAEDWDTAIEVIERNGYSLFATQPAAARELAHRIPAGAFEGRPVGRILWEIFTVTGGTQVEFTPGAMAHGSPVKVPRPEAASGERRRGDDGVARGWRESIRLRHKGDFAGSLFFRSLLHARLADPAHSFEPSIRRYVPMLHLQCGISSMLAGRFADAEQDFEDATQDGRPGFGQFAQRNSFADLALLAGVEGDVPRARENLARMESRPRIAGFWARVTRFGELVAEALVATASLDLPTARRALDDAARSADRDELWALYLLARARHAVAEGSVAAALAEISSLRRTREHLAGSDSAAAFLLPLAEAELLLACGQAPRAGEVLDAAPPHPLLTGVRVLQRLQNGEPAEAIALAGAALWVDEAGPDARALACLARAVAELDLGRREEAAVSFRLAHGIVTRFELRRTLGLLPRAALEELAVLADLPLDLGEIPELLPEPVSPVVLTEREGVVLRALATGSDIGTIARTLFVSENTVRTQVRAVYRKLGAHSRDQAVAEAVRRGIVR